VSRLYGFRLNQLPGLDEASMDPAESAKLYDSSGNAIYIPADLKEKGSSYEGIWDNSILYRSGGQFSISAGGNMDLICGSKLSMTATSQVALTASESIELVGMNTMYGDIGASAATPADAFSAYGYNGICKLVSFDSLSTVGCAGLIADHGMSSGLNNPAIASRSLPSMTIFANTGPLDLVKASATGGVIQLNGTPVVDNILLGGALAVLRPMVAETFYTAFLSIILPLLMTHTHPFPVGPSAELSAGLPAFISLGPTGFAAANGSKAVKIAV
jgi:hypothetical protein